MSATVSAARPSRRDSCLGQRHLLTKWKGWRSKEEEDPASGMHSLGSQVICDRDAVSVSSASYPFSDFYGLMLGRCVLFKEGVF